MIKAIIIRVIVFGSLAYAFGMLAAKPAKATPLTMHEEPAISIYQATEKDKSVIVLQWPSGKTDRLVIKNGDKSGYLIWFNERLNAYERGEK